MPAVKKKILIINIDDLGLDVGSGQAFKDLQKHGSINSGSVMVPCPWFSQIVQLYKNNPDLNIGVHLTLTSEWQQYRWRPLTTNKTSSGLVDSSGFFWRNRKLLREHLNLQSAEIELNAQIKTALNAGIRITHIDCHMGVGLIPELVSIYLKLGIKYNLPVLFPKNIEAILKLYKIERKWLPYYKKIVSNLEKKHYRLVDNFRITPCFNSKKAIKGYEELLTSLNEGSTFLSLHANKKGAIKDIDPIKYYVRIDEYNIFKKYFSHDWMKKHNITTMNLKDFWDPDFDSNRK